MLHKTVYCFFHNYLKIKESIYRDVCPCCVAKITTAHMWWRTDDILQLKLPESLRVPLFLETVFGTSLQ